MPRRKPKPRFNWVPLTNHVEKKVTDRFSSFSFPHDDESRTDSNRPLHDQRRDSQRDSNRPLHDQQRDSNRPLHDQQRESKPTSSPTTLAPIHSMTIASRRIRGQQPLTLPTASTTPPNSIGTPPNSTGTPSHSINTPSHSTGTPTLSVGTPASVGITPFGTPSASPLVSKSLTERIRHHALVFVQSNLGQTDLFPNLKQNVSNLSNVSTPPISPPFSCPYLHRTAGDTERRYHLKYYKTGICIYDTDTRGFCVKNGPHCAFAHGVQDLRNPVYDVREMEANGACANGSLMNGGILGGNLDGSNLNGAPNSLDKERNALNEDPRWQDNIYVLANYKTELCKRPPRLCRQGWVLRC